MYRQDQDRTARSGANRLWSVDRRSLGCDATGLRYMGANTSFTLKPEIVLKLPCLLILGVNIGYLKFS